MTAPDIHTGSAILQARGEMLANMAKVQNQASENVVKSIQGISDNLHRWQDRLDKQAQLKVENDYRNATLDLSKQNLDLNRQKAEWDKEHQDAMRPSEIAKNQASANVNNAEAALKYREIKERKDVEKNINNPPQQDPKDPNIQPINEARAKNLKTGIPFVDNLVAVGRLLNGISNTGQKKAGL